MKIASLPIVLTSLSLFGCVSVHQPVASANHIPCDVEEMVISDNHLVRSNIRQWTATCPAGEFICTAEESGQVDYGLTMSGELARTYHRDLDVSCRPSAATEARLAQEAAIATSRAPKKMAGFTFGSRPETAEQKCVQAGHEWSYRFTHATCSGPAEDVGGDASIELLFCEEKVCAVTLLIELGGRSTWDERFNQTRHALVHNYGAPTKISEYPSNCEGHIAQCVLERQLKYREYWLREDFRVTLEVRPPPGTRVAAIRYR